MARLVIKKAPPEFAFTVGFSYQLENDDVTIGSAPENRIPLPGEGVSPRHAVIRRQPGGSHLLEDLGSTAGTFVSDHRVPSGGKVTLSFWRRIRIGQFEFHYAPDVIPGNVESSAQAASPELSGGWAASPRKDSAASPTMPSDPAALARQNLLDRIRAARVKFPSPPSADAPSSLPPPPARPSGTSSSSIPPAPSCPSAPAYYPPPPPPAPVANAHPVPPEPVPNPPTLKCSVFAPPTVKRVQPFMVQVFAHTLGQAAEVDRLAREFDERAARRAVTTLSAAVRLGSTLTLHLSVTGANVSDPVQRLIWRDEPESVQFGVEVPADFAPEQLLGTVRVSVDEVPVGHVKFTLTVGTANTPSDRRNVGGAMRSYRFAFVSYATADRPEVLKRVQMLNRVGIGYFQDVLSLDPGERWEKALFGRIDDCDLFLLFWSHEARKSEWVQKELRYALDRKRGNDTAPPEVVPVVIDGPPPPAPPDELAHLHFNDFLLYLTGEPSARRRARRAFLGLPQWVWLVALCWLLSYLVFIAVPHLLR